MVGGFADTCDEAENRIKTGGTFGRSNLPPALASANYNANNQQTTFGTSTETYDLNGNLATFTDASGTTTYTWNARNQLTAISGPGVTGSFTYDSFGRRTGKTINGTTTNFLYDNLNPVQEKSGATVTANLLTGLGLDEILTRTDGLGVRSLLTDAIGTSVALGDNTGTLQTQYTYEPFGFVTQTGQANTNSFKYIGREDDGSGLAYYRARYYHPRLQRFISEDPIGFVGGDPNFYSYTLNSPINLIDPDGLEVGASSISGVSISSGQGIGSTIRSAISVVGSAAATAGGAIASVVLFPNDVGEGSDIIPYPDVNELLDSLAVPAIEIPGIGSSCPVDPIFFSKKYQKPPNPNRRKGAEKRQKSGERERNVGHPNAEEHNRAPKGNGPIRR